MMSGTLKKKLAANELCLGSWVTLANAGIAEIFSGAGLDWVAVDLEHSVIDLGQAQELLRGISVGGAAPMVRLSDNDPVQIKRVMDAGAEGIIVPMINSAEEAEKAAESMLYPPSGRRGVGLARAQGYGVDFDAYRGELAGKAVLVPQVEHIDAVTNIEDILAVDQVDGVFIGPYDLSASLGVPGEFDHPSMTEAIAQVEKAVKASGKSLGIHVIEPDLKALHDFCDRGYRFIAYSLDIRILDNVMRQAVEAGKALNRS